MEVVITLMWISYVKGSHIDMKKLVVLLIVVMTVLSMVSITSAQTVVSSTDSGFEQGGAANDLGNVITAGLPGFTDNALATTLDPGVYSFNLSALGEGATCDNLVVYKVSDQGSLDYYDSFSCNPVTGQVIIDTTGVLRSTFVFDISGSQFGTIDAATGETEPLSSNLVA